jgi:hypothetical protein
MIMLRTHKKPRWVWFTVTRAGNKLPSLLALAASTVLTSLKVQQTSKKTGSHVTFRPTEMALFPNASVAVQLHMQQLGDIRMIQVPRRS